MSLLKKSQDLILQKFLDENTFSLPEKKILKNFSFEEYSKTQKKNSFLTQALNLFSHKSLFAPLTYPLDASISEKIKLLGKNLSLNFHFCLLINDNLKNLKVIYPTADKKNIDLNPLLMKKLAILDEQEIIKILSYLLFPDKKVVFHLHKIFVPKNNLAGFLIFDFPSDFLSKKIIADILTITFS